MIKRGGFITFMLLYYDTQLLKKSYFVFLIWLIDLFEQTVYCENFQKIICSLNKD